MVLRDAAGRRPPATGSRRQPRWTEDLTTKDASAYNVQFVGSTPRFIDVGSFERLREGEPWYGYRQFHMHFLLPLMLQAYRGIAFQPLLRADVEGVNPIDARRMMSFWDLVSPRK